MKDHDEQQTNESHQIIINQSLDSRRNCYVKQSANFFTLLILRYSLNRLFTIVQKFIVNNYIFVNIKIKWIYMTKISLFSNNLVIKVIEMFAYKRHLAVNFEFNLQSDNPVAVYPSNSITTYCMSKK